MIPTLDAAETLPGCLAALAAGGDAPGGEAARALVGEVIVADGGSGDGTAEIAVRLGARVVKAPRGRGPQLAAGAAAATGAWLLFLHADTRLAPGWAAAVAGFLADPANAGHAAAFRLAFDDPARPARRVARLANWRARALGLPYGDQGLLLARTFYDSLGGFRPLALMEDVDLVRRIGRRRLRLLAAVAVTSAARYRRDGYWRRPLRNLTCLALYLLGTPPRLIARFYR